MERFPLLPITSKDTFEHCSAYDNAGNDLTTVFICSYPKSGTTWTQAILYHLLAKGRELDHISNYSPFFESDKTWDIAEGEIKPKYLENFSSIGFNVFNTHLRSSMIQKGPNKKFIYVIRHPYDVIVSFYHHLSNEVEGSFEGSFQEFALAWVQGDIAYGKWIHHLQDFFNDSNPFSLVLQYESMKADLFGSVKRVANFLELNVTDEEINTIVPKLTFEGMKSNKDQYQPTSVTWKGGFEFLRKGTVGDSKSLIGEEEEKLIKEMINSVIGEDYPSWFPYTL